ncbi:MAG: cache domain-containing protein, partial [Desulfocapsa sp.]|nr:cache domain-containing protein [Desulfocapsa sp.]
PSSSLEKQSFDNLESMLNLQKQTLEDYFLERTRNLENLVDDVQILKEKEFAKMAAIKIQKEKQVSSFFELRFRDIATFVADPQQQKAFTALSSSNVSQSVQEKYSSYFNGWLKNQGLGSLIMTGNNGRVIYSTDKDIKKGASLTKKAGTPELAAYEKGKKNLGFTDFSRSSLRKDSPAAYFSAPVKQGKQTLGVILFRLPNNAFAEVMQDRTSLGETGEAYMVGPDGMFRSDSRYFEESTLIRQDFLVDTESVAEGLADISGERVIINYRGEYVLSSYMPISVEGLSWVLIVEIDQVEAMTPRQKGEESDYFAVYAKKYGYPDLYLLEPDGYIFYSAAHHGDYRTNILTGEFKDTSFSETVKTVLEDKKMVISDISHYQAADNEAASFLAMPFLQDDQVSMIVALRLPIDQINAIMATRGGLGGSGDSYLVGSDKLWRTESLQAKSHNIESTSLNPKLKVDTKPVREALAGKSGTGITVNGFGDTVLASWKPFSFQELNWAIVNEVNQAEVSKPVTKLLKTSTLLGVGGVVAVLLLSFLVSGGITRQVGAIMGA